MKSFDLVHRYYRELRKITMFQRVTSFKCVLRIAQIFLLIDNFSRRARKNAEIFRFKDSANISAY
jgi:hypothetical protein